LGYTLDNWKMGWPPSFSIAFLAQQWDFFSLFIFIYLYVF
jgi:hypothetical protein